MLNLFSKNKNNKLDEDILYIKTAALLIHAAKIDENYSHVEKNIIKKALIDFGIDKKKIDDVFNKAEIEEANSNQILEFTKKVKDSKESFKIKIVETLWNIIYSDGKSDMYESNFMRRITGLLYLDNKIVGDVKQKIRNKYNK